MKKYFFLGWVIMMAVPSMAQAKIDQNLVLQVQTFLNSIHSLVADFVQTNPDQSQVEGKIWLCRGGKTMGKMRLDYAPAVGQRIIAKDGDFVIYDLNDQSESRYTLDYTPAAFILRPDINLSKDVSVEAIYKNKDSLETTLVPKGDATGQSLTLYFSLYPNGNLKALQQWIVRDGQNNQTLVQFIPGQVVINNASLVSDKVFNP